MLGLLLLGCLIDEDAYRENLARLTDADGDGYVGQDDCDDGDPTIHPGADETCDGLDEDCDGLVDEEPTDAPTWYLDGDGDGHGGEADPTPACTMPDDAQPFDGDCDDSDPAVHPGAEELPYNGVDDDCVDGDLDDVDGDGVSAEEAGGADCDDQDPAVHPGAAETWANGATDDDCDGDYGAATLEYGAAAWTGEAAGDQAGRRLSALGDLDGDGLAEFAVGAPLQSSLAAYAGAVYIVSGGTPGPLGDEGVVRGSALYGSIGGALDGGADQDGDGVVDLLVGGPGVEDGRGAAWLLSGAELPSPGEEADIDAALLWAVRGAEEAAYLGGAAAFVGDVDGDGIGDLAVGASFADVSGFADAGKVGVFTEPVDGAALEDADLVVGGYYEGQKLGGIIEPAGDQDGDGYAEVMLDGDGVTAAIMRGGVAPSDWSTAMLAQVYDDEGASRADPQMIGDVDGDGRNDLAVIRDSNHVLIFTLLAANGERIHSRPTAQVDFEGEPIYLFDLTNLGDLDGDDLDETLIHPQAAVTTPSSWATVLFGDLVSVGAEIPYSGLSLRAWTARDDAAYGYRAALSNDIDGDGNPDILMAGYADNEGGTQAGGVAAIAVPQ